MTARVKGSMPKLCDHIRETSINATVWFRPPATQRKAWLKLQQVRPADIKIDGHAVSMPVWALSLAPRGATFPEMRIEVAALTPQNPWQGARLYGSRFWTTTDGTRVWLFRKGQRVRFYDLKNVQHGPEQTNVAPGIAYALAHLWRSE